MGDPREIEERNREIQLSGTLFRFNKWQYPIGADQTGVIIRSVVQLFSLHDPTRRYYLMSDVDGFIDEFARDDALVTATRDDLQTMVNQVSPKIAGVGRTAQVEAQVRQRVMALQPQISNTDYPSISADEIDQLPFGAITQIIGKFIIDSRVAGWSDFKRKNTA